MPQNGHGGKGGSQQNGNGPLMGSNSGYNSGNGASDFEKGPGSQPTYEPDFTIKEGASDFEKENDFIQFFKHIQGHHSCTHSSMIGPSDHRIPRSGKFDVTKKEILEKL